MSRHVLLQSIVETRHVKELWQYSSNLLFFTPIIRKCQLPGVNREVKVEMLKYIGVKLTMLLTWKDGSLCSIEYREKSLRNVESQFTGLNKLSP